MTNIFSGEYFRREIKKKSKGKTIFIRSISSTSRILTLSSSVKIGKATYIDLRTAKCNESSPSDS